MDAGTFAQSMDPLSGIITVGQGVFVEMIDLYVPKDGALEVESLVSLPDDARLERATFAIAASPSGLTDAVSVADVRAGDGDSVVVDFGRMVTVSGVWLTGAARDVQSVARWTGSLWSGIDDNAASFPEVTTQKLLVRTTGSGDVEEEFRAHGGVWLEAQPTSLELVVDGATVWFERQGSAPDLLATDPSGNSVVPGVSGAIAYATDRTDAVREAFAKARSVEGRRQVSVRLRAATPGRLELNASISTLFEQPIIFGSNSRSSTIQAGDEGTRTLELRGPFSPADQTREVALTISGSFGPERVEPVDGPPVDADAALMLAAGRTVLFGLPVSLSGLFGQLQALRLQLDSPGGGEVAGRLLAATGAGAGPGDPLAKGELPPLQVPAGHSGWLTLAFKDAVSLPGPNGADVVAWLELVPSYGEITCALTTSTDPAAPGAPVLRRLPGGGTKGLSLLREPDGSGLAAPLYAAMRVVGLPGKKDRRPALAVNVPGSSAVAFADPTGDDLRLVIGLGAGVPAQTGLVPLSLRIGAAGSVTVSDVVVAYKKGTPS
jgi:hypothetical protein